MYSIFQCCACGWVHELIAEYDAECPNCANDHVHAMTADEIRILALIKLSVPLARWLIGKNVKADQVTDENALAGLHKTRCQIDHPAITQEMKAESVAWLKARGMSSEPRTLH